jgi:hypothetical protein
MPIIRFSGFVAPKGIVEKATDGPLTFPGHPQVDGVAFRFDITDSVVSVECEIDRVDRISFFILHLWSYYYVRGELDAFSFAHGVGLTLVIDTCMLPNADAKPIRQHEPELEKLCTITYPEVVQLAMNERAILKHLHDLTEALNNPLDSELNCGRAVEGFARLITPSATGDPQRWSRMHAALNTTAHYVKAITDLSKGPRHGAIEPQFLSNIADIRRRAWTIANRFLEYRKGGNAPLSAPKFPQLT